MSSLKKFTILFLSLNALMAALLLIAYCAITGSPLAMMDEAPHVRGYQDGVFYRMAFWRAEPCISGSVFIYYDGTRRVDLCRAGKWERLQPLTPISFETE